MSVKDIVAENQCTGIAVQELLRDQKSLRDAFRLGLRSIIKRYPKICAISQKLLELRQIIRRGNHENVPNARQHQR